MSHSQQSHYDRPAPPYESRPHAPSDHTENTPLVSRQVRLHRNRLHWIVVIFLLGCTLPNVLFFVLYVSRTRSRLYMERSIWEKDFELRLERQREREEHQRHREDQWNQARQKQKLGLHWGNRTAEARCHTYNTRYYHAILSTTPPNQPIDLGLCREIPLEIHGRSIYATRCEAKENGVVHGDWKADYDEPACKPYWDHFYDKGCSAPHSGKRRFEARLENIAFGEDGVKLCYGAPTDVDGTHFNKPESCIHKAEYDIYGTWAAPDDSCL